MSLKAYKWLILALCLVLVAVILVLPKFFNTKTGNYLADGIFVRAASGQPYLVMETEEDPLYIVRLDDGTKEGTLFENFVQGQEISVKTGGTIRDDDIASHATVIEDITKKNKGEVKEVPADVMAEVERIEALYAQQGA